jgi:predicted HTH transcriptional regulator
MELANILKYENDRVEFKQELPKESLKYAKTIASYANSSGGKIIVGVVDETHEVVGVDKSQIQKTCDKLSNVISDTITPQIVPNIYVTEIEDKDVVVCEIYPGMHRPYYIASLGKEKGTYVNVGGTTRAAHAAIIKDLEMQSANESYDGLVYVKAEYDETKADKLCRVIEKYILETEKTERTVTPDQLDRWGVIKREGGKIRPTNTFMMLTDNPFRFARVQCGLFKGTDRVVFIDKREFDGPLYEQIEEAYNFVLKHINLGAEINGLLREDVYELPIKSIREMIINAVTHRSYLENSSVQVAVYDDRVEVTSPGMLSGGLTIQDIIDGSSDVRNKVIATVFANMHIIEDWGTGIRRMIDGCREYGIHDPEFIQLGTKLRVNIYRGNVEEEGKIQFTGTSGVPVNVTLNATENQVLAIIRERPSITAEKLSELTSKTVRTAKRNLASLKNKGVVRRIGSDKTGYWEINKMD